MVLSPRARIAGLLSIGHVLGRGALAVYTILMVRELPRATFGDFAYALALAGILMVVADAGFARLIVRDVARTADMTGMARELLKVRAVPVLAVAALFALLAATPVLSLGAVPGLIAALYLLAEGLAYGYESAAVGAERPWRFVGAQAAGAAAIAAAALIVLGRDGVSAAGALAGLAAASSIKLVAHAIAWRAPTAVRALRELPWRTWAAQALPFVALAALAAVYYRVGIVALHAIRGPAATAPFGAAMRVFDAVALIGGVGFQTVGPALSRLHRERPEAAWATWKRMIGRAALAVVPAVVVLMVAAHPLAGALFGERYRDPAGTLLVLLAPGMGLAVLQNLSAALIFMSDDQSAVIRLTVVNLAALLATLCLLTALAGAEGAAIATTAAELLSFTTFAVLVRRRHRLVAPPIPRAPA